MLDETGAASNAIALLLKQQQASACDSEQLEIKCNDDYVIEIITAELTILHREQHGHASSGRQQDNRVTSAGTRADPSPSNKTSPVAAAGEEPSAAAQSNEQMAADQLICPPLTGRGAPNEWNGAASQTGNGTQIEAGTLQTSACTETEAQDVSPERKAKFLSLVRKQCSLLKSCSVDLGLANDKMPPSNRSVSSSTSSMSQFLLEKCPLNRKLLEIAYKCRPTKIRSKAVCRNARLTLDCSEPSKRLVVGSAQYGFWPEDKKTHDKCLIEERTQQQSQQQQGGTMPFKPPSNCSNNPTLTIGVIARECLFKQQCQLLVQPSQLASCPANQQSLEYLKLVYVCVSEEQLVKTNVSQLLKQYSLPLREHSSGAKSDQSSPDQSSFNSPNVSTSMLIATPPQQYITPPTNMGGLYAASESPSVTMTILDMPGHNRSPTKQTEVQPNGIYGIIASDPQLSSVHPSEWTRSQKVKFVLLHYQKYLIAFAVITITVSTLMALVVRLTCGRRSSRHSNASSATSSKSSSSAVQKSFGSSSSSSSSTNCTNQAACTATVGSHQLLSISGGLGGGFNGGNLANAHQHHLLAAHQNNYSKMPPNQLQLNQAATTGRQQPTNSCSESCFSLDDCSCPHQHAGKQRTFHQHQIDARPINNNSPALQSNQTATPPIEVSSLGNCHTQEQQQQQPQQAGWTSTLNTSGARPKLWSFYVNEQHSNSLRLGNYSTQAGQQPLGGNAAAATLRTQRTFSGQPQPALARNFECLQRQDENIAPIEPHQSEYLLAMANVGQQFQQLSGQQAGLMATGDNWCQTTDNGQRMHLLALAPAELLDGQQQQLSMNSNMGLTCAFHSQQQQQQQQNQQISFATNESTGRNSRQPPPPSFESHQFELPPPAATASTPSATNQANHQFQQLH